MIAGGPTEKELQQLKSIYPLDDKTVSRLVEYVNSLRKWQKISNLIASSTLDNIWSRHIADSLQCLALKPKARIWVDLGSGGGLPGMVIAAALSRSDGVNVHLIESNQKKCAFLRSASREIQAQTTVHCGRIESEAKRVNGADIITARALTALPELLALALPLLSNGATGLFHKGRGYRSELEDCSGLWNFDLVEHRSEIEADSVLLEITNLTKVETEK